VSSIGGKSARKRRRGSKMGKSTGGSLTSDVMDKLKQDERDELFEIFSMMDGDNGGSVSTDEMKIMLRTLGINISDSEVAMMIDEIDENGDNEIQFDEFVAVMTRKVKATHTPDQVLDAFKVFESSGAPPGYISIEQLRTSLQKYGKDTMEPEAIDDLLSQVDYDKTSGLFHYSQYIQMMMK
jgi:calmodulin